MQTLPTPLARDEDEDFDDGWPAGHDDEDEEDDDLDDLFDDDEEDDIDEL